MIGGKIGTENEIPVETRNSICQTDHIPLQYHLSENYFIIDTLEKERDQLLKKLQRYELDAISQPNNILTTSTLQKLNERNQKLQSNNDALKNELDSVRNEVADFFSVISGLEKQLIQERIKVCRI
jgi:hypothetical protein